MKPHTSIRNSISAGLNWYSLTNWEPQPKLALLHRPQQLASYYVSQTIATTGCEGPRSEIIVTVNPRPTALCSNDRDYCQNEIALPLSTPSPNCSLSGIQHLQKEPQTQQTLLHRLQQLDSSYYVSQTMTTTGCEGPRTEIIITITPIPLVRNITITQCDTDLISDGRTILI
jgi:hypothetical protein